MSTKTLVDRLLPFCKGWNATGTLSLLDMIQRGQDELLAKDTFYSRYFDISSTGHNKGFPPYLITTAGKYKYDIIASNLANSAGTALASISKNIDGVEYAVRCKRVLRVFVDISKNDYNKRWIGRPALYYFPNPYSTQTERIAIAEVPVDNVPALENTNAYIFFKEDPGNSNNKFFVEFIWEAPRLTAQTVPLVIPTEYEEAIFDYVMGQVAKRKNGRANNDYIINFYTYWLPRFAQEMNAGAQSDNLEVIPVTV